MTSETLTTAKREARETKAQIRDLQDKLKALDRVIVALSPNGTAPKHKDGPQRPPRAQWHKRTEVVSVIINTLKAEPDRKFYATELLPAVQAKFPGYEIAPLRTTLYNEVRKQDAQVTTERSDQGRGRALLYRYKPTTIHPE